MADYINKDRLLIPEFKIENIVYLNKRNIKLLYLNWSFNLKNLESFRIKKEYDNSYIFELKLPNFIKGVYNVFHL